MTVERPIRLAILGTGGMAKQHAKQFGTINNVDIVAGIDIDESRLTEFCDQFDITSRFQSIEAALDWNAFDAVANATPDNLHYPTTMQCLAAGKHVFCEKPLATSFEHALLMTEAASRSSLIAMVNLSYREVPALQKAREMVLAGKIGEVRHFEASYLQSWLTASHWGDWQSESKWLWRLSTKHGSNGVLGDVGIHILDFACYGVASDVERMSARLKTFNKIAGNRIGEYQLDANDSFAMIVELENGALGTIHASRCASGYADDLQLRIFGTQGGLTIEFGYGDGDGLRKSKLSVCIGENRHTQKWIEMPLPPVETNYQKFIRAIQQGETLEPSFGHAAKLQRTLDEALLVEKQFPEQQKTTV